ncbi:uncharacterized protein LOC106650659 [Trichogramma pretiosum]|uniref:uncharacterized protein LOC106650659 n=1 Tax=Trichogramma pretiosum TaxID=7493 RepID=UPI0006C9B795|nr:uncharacterized protein LOC106650659 [Trichogramma pretiosum]
MTGATSSGKEARLKEVKSIIRSLLISNIKIDVKPTFLDSMYFDLEGKRIPFREFGYQNLIEFLSKIPDTTRFVKNRAGEICVKHVDTEKSAHISDLVYKQKAPPAKKRKAAPIVRRPSYNNFSSNNNNYYKSLKPSNQTNYHSRQPSNQSNTTYNTGTNYRRPNMTIPAKIPENHPITFLSDVLREFRYNMTKNDQPMGIRKSELLFKVNALLDRSNHYTIFSLNAHLRQIPDIEIVNDFVYFKDLMKKMTKAPVTIPTPANIITPAPANIVTSTPANIITPTPLPKPICVMKSSNSLNHDSAHKSIDVLNDNHYRKDISESYQNSKTNSNVKNETNTAHCSTTKEFDNLSIDKKLNGYPEVPKEFAVNDKLKLRLEKLLQNNPEGIWCSDLPKIYENEYGIEFEFQEYGFQNILAFLTSLDDICRIVTPPDANNRSMVVSKISNDQLNGKKPLASLYNFKDYVKDSQDPVPIKLSADVSKSLIPENVLTKKDSLDVVHVTSIDKNYEEYVEVVVSEVFTPSFFWVHLRKNIKKLKAMMELLDLEYSSDNDVQYLKVPQVLIEPGLNIACRFDHKWHRGMVKKTKPDGYVTIFFYDYGTVKTYNPNDIYFLKKKFATLPIQAIPCALYNVVPLDSTDWPTVSTKRFTSKVWGIPLVASISDIDEEQNSLTVALTDTSDDFNDLHINDWMVENGLADWGKMITGPPIERLLSYEIGISAKERKSKTKRRPSDRKKSSESQPAIDLIDFSDSADGIVPRSEPPVIKSLVKNNLSLADLTNDVAKQILVTGSDTKSNSSRSSRGSVHEKSQSCNRDDAISNLSSNLSSLKVYDSNENKFSEPLSNHVSDNVEPEKMTNYLQSLTSLIKSSPVVLRAKDSVRPEDLCLPIKGGSDFSEDPSVYSDDEMTEDRRFTFKNGTPCIEIKISNGDSKENLKHEVAKKSCEKSSDESVFEQQGDVHDTRDNVSTYSSVQSSKRTIKILYPSQFAAKFCKRRLSSSSTEKSSVKHLNKKTYLTQFTKDYSSEIDSALDSNTTPEHQTANEHSSENDSASDNNTAPEIQDSKDSSPEINRTTDDNIGTKTAPSFKKICLTERCGRKLIHIFYLENDGWITAGEMTKAFTNLVDQRVLFKLLEVCEVHVDFKYVDKDSYPELFDQLNKSEILADRDENNNIFPTYQFTLVSLIDMLEILEKLMFLDASHVRDAVPIMKQHKDNLDLEKIIYEKFRSEILFDVLNSVVKFREFRDSLKSTTS